MLRPRERGQCSPRNRAGTEAPASREGSGLGAEPPGFSPLPPFPLWPASLFLFFFLVFIIIFFRLAPNKSFVLKVKRQDAVVFLPPQTKES